MVELSPLEGTVSLCWWAQQIPAHTTTSAVFSQRLLSSLRSYPVQCHCGDPDCSEFTGQVVRDAMWVELPLGCQANAISWVTRPGDAQLSNASWQEPNPAGGCAGVVLVELKTGTPQSPGDRKRPLGTTQNLPTQ